MNGPENAYLRFIRHAMFCEQCKRAGGEWAGAQKRSPAQTPGEERLGHSLSEAQRELEAIAREKDLRRYGETSDRELELRQREQRMKFEKYRRQKKE